MERGVDGAGSGVVGVKAAAGGPGRDGVVHAARSGHSMQLTQPSTSVPSSASWRRRM